MIPQKLSDLDYYKTFIGKEVIVQGKKRKVTAIRKSGDMILLYYEFFDPIAKNKEGVINSEICKNPETNKPLYIR